MMPLSENGASLYRIPLNNLLQYQGLLEQSAAIMQLILATVAIMHGDHTLSSAKEGCY